MIYPDIKKLNALGFDRSKNKGFKTRTVPQRFIQISADEIPWSPPPANASVETFQEIDLIQKAVNDDKQSDFFNEIADKKPMMVFKSYANLHDLQFDEKYFKAMLKELKSIIVSLKDRYDRPRPYQVARAYGIEIPIADIDSSKTPAYPSGHALQAAVIAGLLSSQNPDHEEALRNVADRVGLSGMQIGVHFPSDLSYGKELATLILPHIDTLALPGGIMLENRSDLENFKKLRVLDFDDTIALTTELVRVETPRGPKFLPSSEFATYELGPGEFIDPEVGFSEFEKVNVRTARPVPFVSDLLKSFVSAESPESRKILILTARNEAVRPFVMKFLDKKLGIKNPESIVDFVGVGEPGRPARAEDKVEVIKQYLETYPSIEFVSFFDDSGENVRKVKHFIETMNAQRSQEDMISSDIRQVVEDEETGEVKLVHPESTDDAIGGEEIDLREITKRFFQKYH